MSMLEVKDLQVYYGVIQALKGISFHVEQGEVIALIGANGAGKTTVMKMITNLWKPTNGTIEIFGETLSPQSYEVLKRMGGYFFRPVATGRKSAFCLRPVFCR